MAKDFLKENNVQFESLDVSQNKEALMEMREKTGQMGVPVIDIDGKVIIGFDKDAIKAELGL
jgi:glutaredoxin